jgi:hypothetical protein
LKDGPAAGWRGTARRPPAPAGAAAIPLGLRVCWWVLVVADAALAAAEIGLAVIFDRPYALVLWLFGPLCCGATLALIAWWHTRGPGRRLWAVSEPFSPLPACRRS